MVGRCAWLCCALFLCLALRGAGAELLTVKAFNPQVRLVGPSTLADVGPLRNVSSRHPQARANLPPSITGGVLAMGKSLFHSCILQFNGSECAGMFSSGVQTLVSAVVSIRFLDAKAYFRTLPWLRRAIEVRFQFTGGDFSRLSTKELLLQSQSILRVQSFDPYCAEDGAILCDERVVAEQQFDQQQVTVVEECGPVTSWTYVPDIVANALTLRTVISSREAKVSAVNSKTVDASCTLQLPVFLSKCFRFSSQTPQEAGLLVDVRVIEDLDRAWVGLAIAFLCLTVIEMLVRRSVTLQYVCAALFGAAVLLFLVAFWLVRDSSRSRMGLLAFASVVVAGGVLGFAEGIMQTTTTVVMQTLEQNALAQVAFLLTCIATAGTSRWVLGSSFSYVIVGLIRTMRMLVLFLGLAHNREATVLCAGGFFLLYQWFPVLLWCLTPAPLEPRYPESDDEEPLPAAAFRAQGTIRPMVRSGITTGTIEQRFVEYEKRGKSHTERALEELAAKIRANPNKYSGRLQDPDQVLSWANAK